MSTIRHIPRLKDYLCSKRVQFKCWLPLSIHHSKELSYENLYTFDGFQCIYGILISISLSALGPTHKKCSLARLKMTGLRSKKVKKSSFQNIKMSGKVNKIRKKLSITGTNIVQDIHELVVELKRTVIELEDIASKLQVRQKKKQMTMKVLQTRIHLI